VLTYNHGRFIKPCLNSLLALDYPNKEICLLDDGSSDDTFEIATKTLSAANCKVTLRTQPNSGGQTASNSQKLLGLAEGRYVLFMSGDDALTVWFDAERSISTMEGDPSIAMCIARAIYVHGTDCSYLRTIYTREFTELLQTGDPEAIFRGHLCKRVSLLFLQGAIVRKSFVEEFGGFDTAALADDYAFMFRAVNAMRQTRRRFVFESQNMWLYRLHDEALHTRHFRQREAIFQIVAKYVPPECWDDFSFDHPTPLDAADFPSYCDQLTRHFGARAGSTLIEKTALRYARTRFSGDGPDPASAPADLEAVFASLDARLPREDAKRTKRAMARFYAHLLLERGDCKNLHKMLFSRNASVGLWLFVALRAYRPVLARIKSAESKQPG
jgi:glycosyltransferase involved in cell wall biosynthesis